MEVGSEWCSASVDIDASHDTVVVRLRGEIDLATAEILAGALEAATATSCPRAVLDLAELAFLDVRGVRAIATCRAQLRAEGRDLLVRRPSRIVQTLLRAAEVDLDVEADMEVDVAVDEDRAHPTSRRVEP